MTAPPGSISPPGISPSGSGLAPSAQGPAPTPSPGGAAASGSSGLGIPGGVYHLSSVQAHEVGQASRFYEAYNAGDVDAVMALLSMRPKLTDCDYSTHSLVALDGRTEIETFLRARFADHDRWTVEFYQERPDDDRQVVIVPESRQSDTLRNLGAPGGAKQSFAILLSLEFAPDRSHLDQIQSGSVMGPAIVKELCTP